MLGGPQKRYPRTGARPIRARRLPHGPGGFLSQDPFFAAPAAVEATPRHRVCPSRELPRLVPDQMAMSSRGWGSTLECATGLARRALGFGALAHFERRVRMHAGQNVHQGAPAPCRRSQPMQPRDANRDASLTVAPRSRQCTAAAPVNPGSTRMRTVIRSSQAACRRKLICMYNIHKMLHDRRVQPGQERRERRQTWGFFDGR